MDSRKYRSLRIYNWCYLASYLGIGMSIQEYRKERAKAEIKWKFEIETEHTLRTAVRNHIESVGADSFAKEIRLYNQTLPKGVRKRKPETWMNWAGCDTERNRQLYYEFSGEDGSVGLSFDSWRKYCYLERVDEREEELMSA